MATITAYSRLDMSDTDFYADRIVSITPTRIEVANGPISYRFTGRFSGDGTNVLGTLTGYEVFNSGTRLLSATGLSVDATYAFQQVATGDIFDLLVTALRGNDRINGSGGNDILGSGAGQDSIFGNGGDDELFGMAGNDLIDGGTGFDVAWFGMGSNVRVSLAQTGAQATGDGFDTLRSIEGLIASDGTMAHFTGNDAANRLEGAEGRDTLLGGRGNDTLTGLAGHDSLRGDSGHDRLIGGDGNDTLDGGTGDDVLMGGNGADTVVFAGTVGARVDLQIRTAQDTGYGRDTLTSIDHATGGSGADRLWGSSAANRLIGDRGNDMLEGRSGNDTLMGGTGSDRLVGGTGTDRLFGGADTARDVFVFTALSDSRVGTARDTIEEFRNGIDDIDLSALDANTAVAGNQAFTLSSSGAAANAVWVVASTGGVILRADVTGDGVADLELRVLGISGVTTDDLIL